MTNATQQRRLLAAATQQRDASGRLLAADGWPVGGLASVQEVVAATKLSKSTIYQMIGDAEFPVKRFGKSVRVPWQIVRSVFLDDSK